MDRNVILHTSQYACTYKFTYIKVASCGMVEKTGVPAENYRTSTNYVTLGTAQSNTNLRTRYDKTKTMLMWLDNNTALVIWQKVRMKCMLHIYKYSKTLNHCHHLSSQNLALQSGKLVDVYKKNKIFGLQNVAVVSEVAQLTRTIKPNFYLIFGLAKGN